jgi:ArsR family transcriptional regulator, arsenate/arsenite/antimonite-responsive transcriptional repressor
MELDELVKVFKALGCDQRIKIIQMLREWEGIDACCDGVLKAFTRMSEEIEVSRSTLSHHFKELENAGLIVCERQGQAMQCKVNEELLSRVKEFF